MKLIGNGFCLVNRVERLLQFSKCLERRLFNIREKIDNVE